MKKIAFAVLLLAVSAVPVWGQLALTRHAESKKMDMQILKDGLYAGQHNGLDCWVGEGRKGRKQVVLSDHNLEPLGRMEMVESSVNYTLLSASALKGMLSAVLYDSPDRQHTVVYGALVDLDSMKPAGIEPITVLDSFSYGKKDRCMVWAATSPNRQYTALTVIVEYTERNQYSARVRLMDSHLNTVWAKDYAMGSMEHMCVTDRGRVVTLGQERDGEETHIVYNIIDEHRSDSYEVTVTCDPMRELRLAGVVGSHVMAVGTFMPAGADPDEMLCGGVVGMSFDMDSALMTGFTMRPFQNEDMNILYNKKTKKIQRDQVVDLVSVLDATTTQWGAAVAVGRNFMNAHVEDNGTTTKGYYREGIHLVGIDTLGRVCLVRNIRRNDVQKGSDDMLRIGLLSRYGTIYIVKSEHKSYPATYDISKEAKEFAVDTKGNLVVYTIQPGGEVGKTVVETKTPHALVRCVMRPDDTMELLTADGSRKRMAELKIR